MKKFLLCFFFLAANTFAQSVWQTNLGAKPAFYQTTDFGIVLAGTDNSLTAIDGQTGEKIWSRTHRGLDETSITPVPSTDLILLSLDEGDKSRLEAVDLLSGETVWQSEKVKGDVMQLAVEPEKNLLAVVLVKKAIGKIGEEVKREPVMHVLKLNDGGEIWKAQLKSDVAMMPSHYGENLDEISFTLDNYRSPLILDGRIYLFYEGVTSYDAQTGAEGERERFQVNEDGLALTEADPVFDEKYLFTSGHGKIRAVNRGNYKIEWEAKDLGVTSEMAVVGNILYVRSGGQFTRLKDGEIEERGSFGISAIDTKNGKTLWRFKDADKGLTNFVFADRQTVALADRNELVTLNAQNGKVISKIKHKIEKAQFVLINESGAAVVGGRDELAAFQISSQRQPNSKANYQKDFSFHDNTKNFVSSDSPLAANEVWRVRHKPPGRGIVRLVAGIALRAAAIYFRYGGLATSALNLIQGASIARSVLALRWSGLKTRFASFDLTTLAANSAKNYVSGKIYAYGAIARTPDLLNRVRNLQIPTTANLRGQIIGGAVRRVSPSGSEVKESLLERIDPIRRVEKLSDYLLRRQRLADLRGNFMYFYSDLPEPFNRKGLIGVNVHTGKDVRFILISDPDARFTVDETAGLLYSADGNRLSAFDILTK